MTIWEGEWGLVKYLRLAMVFIKYQYKSQLIYKGSFVINAISQIVSYAVSFALMWIMVNAFGTINGWNKYEVMLLYAMSLTSYSLAGTLFFHIGESMPKEIHKGSFDDVLVKPVNPLAYYTFGRFNAAYIAHFSLAVTMIVVCFINLGIQMTVFRIIFFIVIVLTGGLVYASFFLFTSVPAFFTTKAESLVRIVFSLRAMSYYPLSIFPQILQVILTFIIPYGMINFYPVQSIIDKNDFLMFGPIMRFFAPGFAIILFAAAVRFFNYGVKHYKSTGS